MIMYAVFGEKRYGMISDYRTAVNKYGEKNVWVIEVLK